MLGVKNERAVILFVEIRTVKLRQIPFTLIIVAAFFVTSVVLFVFQIYGLELGVFV